MGASLCNDLTNVVNIFQKLPSQDKHLQNQMQFQRQRQELNQNPNQSSSNATNNNNNNQDIKNNQENNSFPLQSDINQINVIVIPQLSEQIKTSLIQNKPSFWQQLQSHQYQKKIIKFGSHIYQGKTLYQNQKPNGYGKLYLDNQNFLIGSFNNSIVQGQAIYIFKNGNFFKGQYKNNNPFRGKYKSKQILYQGLFQNGLFHGHGKQIGVDHEFIGTYEKGRKKQGLLKWNKHKQTQQFDYIYEGKFDDNEKFTEFATLQQLKGIYQGQFKNGQKNGKGTYKYKYGLKYIGQYKNDLKNGQGILYNQDESIGYNGEWQNGFPHGQGYVLSNKNQNQSNNKNEKYYSQFNKGVDKKLLFLS